jgi:hypothetical protein
MLESFSAAPDTRRKSFPGEAADFVNGRVCRLLPRAWMKFISREPWKDKDFRIIALLAPYP